MVIYTQLNINNTYICRCIYSTYFKYACMYLVNCVHAGKLMDRQKQIGKYIYIHACIEISYVQIDRQMDY